MLLTDVVGRCWWHILDTDLLLEGSLWKFAVIQIWYHRTKSFLVQNSEAWKYKIRFWIRSCPENINRPFINKFYPMIVRVYSSDDVLESCTCINTRKIEVGKNQKRGIKFNSQRLKSWNRGYGTLFYQTGWPHEHFLLKI